LSKILYLFMILTFLFSCSSERSFKLNHQERLGVGKDDVAKKKEDSTTDLTDHGREADTNADQTKNTPPKIKSVYFMPEVFHPGDALRIEAAGADADGDPVTLLYEWRVNGESAGEGSALDVPVRRGDKISVKITPFDGKENGPSVVLDREIVNMPPMIVEDNNFEFDGKTYTYQVKASDPDKDSLTYSLKSAPESMWISPTSGLILWDVPKEFNGSTKVSVLVDDGQGGRSEYEMNINIREEKPVEKNM